MVVEIQIAMGGARENLRRTFAMDEPAIRFAAILLTVGTNTIERAVNSEGSYNASSGCLFVRVAREPNPKFQLGVF